MEGLDSFTSLGPGCENDGSLSSVSCSLHEEEGACRARELPSDRPLDPDGRMDPGCVHLGFC